MTMTPAINGWTVTATKPFRQWRRDDGFRAQELLVSNQRRGRRSEDRFAGILIYDPAGKLVGHVGDSLALVSLTKES